MPWKERYTVCDEVSLKDHELKWPSGNRMAVHITVALSPASGPEGITAADMESSLGRFAMGEGLDLLVAVLARHKLLTTFAVPALMAEIMPDGLRTVAEAGHEIAAMGLRHEDTSAMPREEEAARVADPSVTILRATQFHEFAAQMLERAKAGPVVFVPREKVN